MNQDGLSDVPEKVSPAFNFKQIDHLTFGIAADKSSLSIWVLAIGDLLFGLGAIWAHPGWTQR